MIPTFCTDCDRGLDVVGHAAHGSEPSLCRACAEAHAARQLYFDDLDLEGHVGGFFRALGPEISWLPGIMPVEASR